MAKKRKEQVTVEYLHECLDYNPKTGIFTWKPPLEGHKRYRARWAGKRAFTSIQTAGYFVTSIDNCQYLAQRVAWAMYHREWPEYDMCIDHIDGDRLNNRIENLRKVTHAQNNAFYQELRRKKGIKYFNEGRILWNDGERHYWVPSDEHPINLNWVKGRIPKKS